MKRLAAIVLGLMFIAGACTTAGPPVPRPLDVRGVWIGDWAFEPSGSGHGVFSMTLNQNGTDISGAVQLTGLDRTTPTQVTGVVKDNEIYFVGVASSGTLKVRGNEMSGTLQSDGMPVKVVARRQTD